MGLDIVIPAAGDAALLGRCLLALLCDGRGLDLLVIVTANGPAVEANFEQAVSFEAAFAEEGHALTVLRNEEGGKAAALNLGDRSRGPRIGNTPVVYLDSDTIILPGTLTAIAAALTGTDAPLLVAPRMVIPEPERGWLARSFARIWPRLPNMADDVAGAGLYATNPAGRGRWCEFPPIAADDLYVRSRFGRQERRVLAKGGFVFHVPLGSDLIRAKRRWDRGNRAIEGVLPSRSLAAKCQDALRLCDDPLGLAGFICLCLAARLSATPADLAADWAVSRSKPFAPVPARRPRLGVCVVTHNSASGMEACLRSIRSSWAGLMTVEIEDNASTDATVRLAHGQGVSVQANSDNLGFAASVNRITARLSVIYPDYFLLINPDAVLGEGAIDHLFAAALASGRDPVMVGGRMRQEEDEAVEPTSCMASPSLRQAIAFACGCHRWPLLGPRLDPDSLGGWDRTGMRTVPVLTGALLLIGVPLWTRLRGFDEAFFLYGEDADFCVRAKKFAEADVHFTGFAEYTHAGGASSADESRRWCAILRGKVSLYRKHLRPPQAWIAVQSLCGGVALRAVAERIGLVSGLLWTSLWRQRKQWLRGWAGAVYDEKSST